MLRRHRQRDEVDWFERAVDEHQDRLYTFARYYLRDDDDAADALQETFMRLWTHRDDVDRGRMRAWLTRVCRNACLDRIRSRQARGRVEVRANEVYEPASDGPLPDADATSGQLRRMVLDRLDEMSEPYRSLVVLRDIQDMSYAEISDALDLPMSTVKVYLHRARRRLREELPEELRNEAV